MEELLKTIAMGLVDNPDAVTVTVDEADERGNVVYHLHVAEGDMGRVIGKQGRIAKAIRTVMKARATKDGIRVQVDID
ncbi:MAG: KH domain-containing protein [Candidatus Fimenecus sp.]